jgi:hypothetical protein
MKNRRFSLTAILILSVLIVVYLVWDYIRDESELKVVTLCSNACKIMDDDVLYLNYTRSWQTLGSTSRSCDTVAIPAAEGDLVMFSGPWDAFDYFRYDLSDGQILSFEYDTMLPGATFMNGKLLSIFMDYETKWQHELTDQQIGELRVIHTGEDPMTEKMYELLGRIAAVNKDVGLVFEGGDREEFHKVVSMFRPEWMAIPDSLLPAGDDRLLKNMKDLDLLYLVGTDAGDFDIPDGLTDLESLIIDYSSSSDTVPIHLEKLRGLESLTLVGYDAPLLSGSDLPQSLNSLYLVSCESIGDLSWLNKYPMLRELGMARCDSLEEFSVLDEIPSLRWLSLPPRVSQEDFTRIISRHRDLEGLEMIGCEDVTDLSPLNQLKKLESLALDLRKVDFESLKQLPAIKLIVINEKHFTEEGTEIAGLKKALPQTYIVPGSGYCLGSGWLLLMLPFLLMAVLFRAIFRR